MRDALYARAQAIAHEVLNLAPRERDARLAELCGNDGELRREAQWLIAAADDDSLDAIPDVIVTAASDIAADIHIDAAEPGRYRLIERLGEGGMGVVWLAERAMGGALQRVALKRLRTGMTTAGQYARFRVEQRILAALNHPNIAHLVDAGVDGDGNPFLAMEYVAGERIDRWCTTRDLSLRARIELFVKLCAAVSYAHERLVIHRDLKPANILIDASGEPKLLDFGIARLIDDDAARHTATRMMTPAYASPEQIAGEPLGTATDVWSLGVMLYELLAGVRPFEHIDTDHARAQAILSAEVTPPSRQTPRAKGAAAVGAPAKSPRFPADIDAIVLKALRRQPEQRYASVREFADDLGNFLVARPVKARRGQWTYRAQRFVQRNRWPLAAALVLLTVSTGFTWRTVLAEREARLHAQVADRTTEFLISTFALSDPTSAESHDFSARDVLDRGRERVDTELAGQPRVRARLLEALGNAYRGINEGTAGAPLLEQAAQLNLDPAVNDPLAAARNLRAKALSILEVRGSTEEAQQAAQRALDLVHLHGNGDKLLSADANATLARTLDASGQEALAADLAKQALALREIGGAGPLAIAQSLVEICGATTGTGEYAQAVAYCERALPLYVEAGAASGNDYRTALGTYASALLYKGDTDRGIAVQRQRLALTLDIFGADSSVLAMDRIRFSETLANNGLFADAAATLADGMALILKHNDKRSTQYAQAVFQAGWLKFHLGQFDAAVPLVRQAHDIQRTAVQGRDNNRLQVLRVTLAMALIESGRADAEARGLLESVIAAKGPAALPVVLAFPRLPLAQWLVIHGEYDQAEALLDQVQAIGDQGVPELHARAASTRAKILRARGDQAGALDLLRAAFEVVKRGHGAEQPLTARYALAYALALRSAGEVAQAEALEHAYRPLLERAYPPDSAFRRLLQES